MAECDLQAQLKNIANVAYGSGMLEKTRGGAGNIALFSGHVIKFNTHRGDRGGTETDEMKCGCDNLRRELDRIAIGLLRDSGLSADEFQREIGSIRAKLGLDPQGRMVIAKKLLDRQTVASVIRRIDTKIRIDSFADAPDKSASTKNTPTAFTSVKNTMLCNLAATGAANPVQPLADKNAIETLDETIIRGAEKEMANVHKSLAEQLARKVLVNVRQPEPGVSKMVELSKFGEDLDLAGRSYGLVSKMTLSDLKEALGAPESEGRQSIKSALEVFGRISETCRSLFVMSGGKELLLAELASIYKTRAMELDALVAEVKAENGNVQVDAVSVGTRLVQKAVGREETRKMLEMLQGRLTALAQDLSEIKRNAAEDKSAVDNTARLKRFEIDLNVASEGIRNLMTDEYGRMMGPDQKWTDMTVLRGLRKEVDSMRQAIREIRGATIDKLGIQLVDDHCTANYPDVFMKILENDLKTAATALIGAGWLKGKDADAVARIIRRDLQSVPPALENLKNAIRSYLGAKDTKSAASALKVLGKRANALKYLLSRETGVFLSYLADDGRNSDKVTERLKGDEGISFLQRCNKLGPSLAKRLESVDNEDGIDRLVGQVKWFRTYLQTDFGARAADDKLLEGLRTGQYGVGTYVGARAWQATPDMIDPSLQEKDLVESEPLGGGAFNTAYLCLFQNPDGTERSYVFKPEQVGRNAVERSSLMRGGAYRSDQQLAHLNFASARAAHELGMSGKVPGVRVGFLHGSFGMFMDVAPGVSVNDMLTKRVSEKERLMRFMGLNSEGLLPDGETPNAANIGKIAHATTDLEWLDAVIGNGDRHGGNFHVDIVNNESVTVTGIDNDTTFPPWHLGFGKYRMRLDSFKDQAHEMPATVIAQLTGLYGQIKGLSEAITLTEDGFVIIDLYKIDAQTENGKKVRSWLAALAQDVFGFQRFARPNFISHSTYDKLRLICCGKDADAGNPRLLDDGTLTEYVRKTYGVHLKDADQVEAMVSRLKDAWCHAQHLKEIGRLVKDDADWGSKACYDNIRSDWKAEQEFKQLDFTRKGEDYKRSQPYLSILNRSFLSLFKQNDVFYETKKTTNLRIEDGY